jgi:Zn finger protein HypA/HybF involved in hydrogenase expression
MTDDKILCCRECSDVVELERVEETLVCPVCGKVYEDVREGEA